MEMIRDAARNQDAGASSLPTGFERRRSAALTGKQESRNVSRDGVERVLAHGAARP